MSLIFIYSIVTRDVVNWIDIQNSIRRLRSYIALICDMISLRERRFA